MSAPRPGRGRGPGPRTLGGVLEELDAPLAPLTTLRLGGPARRLVTAHTDDEVIAAVRAADAAGGPRRGIGGGAHQGIRVPPE
ncbi:hypothetical protein ACFXAF_17115, partial [Kitasatospora sp. NPDC059463]